MSAAQFGLCLIRQIAPPPSDKNAVLILICSVIERRVGRLKELLQHEEIGKARGRRAVQPRGHDAARHSSGTAATSRPGTAS